MNRTSFHGFNSDGSYLTISMTRMRNHKAMVGITLKLEDNTVLTYETLTTDESPEGDEMDPTVISAGGLRIHTIEPLTKYRVVFSGALQRQDGQWVQVTFRIWVRPLADPAWDGIDTHPYLVAEWLSSQKFSVDLLKQALFPGRRFEQLAEMRGKVEIQESVSDKTNRQSFHICCYGVRIRDWSMWNENCQNVFLRLNNGCFATLRISGKESNCSRVVGYVHRPNGWVYGISWTDVLLTGCPNGSCHLNFKAGSRMYSITLEEERHNLEPVEIVNDILFVTRTLVKFQSSCSLNGTGEIEAVFDRIPESFRKQIVEEMINVPRLKADTNRDSHQLLLNLADEKCCNSKKTGGKASKLACLLQWKSENKNNEFAVPKGFVLTVDFYRKFMQDQREIRQAIEKLNHCEENLESNCNELEKMITDSQLSPNLFDRIAEWFDSMFDSGAKLAVRSSAVGEDGSESSGAGQMETFLNISTKEGVVEAIKKCWASHFAFRAVEYRKKFGSAVDCPMAVIVQELVPADVAGVLFTRDPDNGSTVRMVINANTGLGESVVSGTEEVDTISVYIFDKKQTISYDSLRGSKCCLTESEISELVHCGRLIEKVFGAGRDIEWAVTRRNNGEISLSILQARPITTMDMEEDWELVHESDSPLASDKEWITTANVQEVLPGAMTPLTLSIFHDLNIGECFEDELIRVRILPQKRSSILRCMLAFDQRYFFNYHVKFSRKKKKYSHFHLSFSDRFRKFHQCSWKMRFRHGSFG